MKSELLTSQIQLKAILAGTATPAFTPLTADVSKLIDPEFVLGGRVYLTHKAPLVASCTPPFSAGAGTGAFFTRPR